MAARAAARRHWRGRSMFKKLFRKSTGSSGSPAKDDADSPGTSPAGKEPAGKELMAGIGIVFQLAPDGGLYIKSMSPDGAAHESGILQQGDCLMSVDGVNVFGKSAEFVTSKIMGKVGSPVATKFRYFAALRPARSSAPHNAWHRPCASPGGRALSSSRARPSPGLVRRSTSASPPPALG